MPGTLPAERERAVSAQEPSRSRVSRITGVPRGLGLGQLLLRVLSQGPACHPARPHPRPQEPRPCLPDPKPQAWTQPSSGGGRATAKVTSSAQPLAELREGPISLSLSPVIRSSQAASEGDAGESGGAETRVLPAHREGTKGPGGLPSGRRPPAAQPALGRNDAFPAGRFRLSGSPDSRALQVRWASAGPLQGRDGPGCVQSGPVGRGTLWVLILGAVPTAIRGAVCPLTRAFPGWAIGQTGVLSPRSRCADRVPHFDGWPFIC